MGDIAKEQNRPRQDIVIRKTRDSSSSTTFGIKLRIERECLIRGNELGSLLHVIHGNYQEGILLHQSRAKQNIEIGKTRETS